MHVWSILCNFVQKNYYFEDINGKQQIDIKMNNIVTLHESSDRILRLQGDSAGANPHL